MVIVVLGACMVWLCNVTCCVILCTCVRAIVIREHSRHVFILGVWCRVRLSHWSC